MSALKSEPPLAGASFLGDMRVFTMPTRYLKPGIRDSELIDALTPLAEVLFYRLIVTVDDFGRFDARPSMIKSQCFPIRDKVTAKSCEELLKELSAAGLVSVYQVDGKPYLQLCKWDNKPRSTESKFPAFTNGCIQLYADVCNPLTSLPVTVTVTVTKTETDNSKPDANASPPEGVTQQTWDDWLKLRKTKRAPVTKTVINGAIAESQKAGMCLEDFLKIWCNRGSQGLEASWLRQEEKTVNRKSFKESDKEAGMVRWEQMTGEVHPDRNPQFIDFLNGDVRRIEE